MRESRPQASKTVENTVFLRFTPYNPELRRHTIQDAASEIGPIKKCSVIHKNERSYGFCKFTCRQDAVTAATQLNRRTLGTTMIHAELASRQGQEQQQQEEPNNNNIKKTSRLIIRNLSFYAKEKDIRQAIEPLFGSLLEVHIPVIAGKQSRGFAFITFSDAAAAQNCCDHTSPVVIRNRNVEIARALHKTAYESENKTKNNKKPKAQRETESNDDNSVDVSDAHDGSNDAEVTEENESGDDDPMPDDDDDDAKSGAPGTRNSSHDKTAVAEKRCIFMRNLPFDCTRHDVFELFRQFGYITAVYLVKDNNVPKGTAFVSFQTPEQAEKALLEAADSGEFQSQHDALSTRDTSHGIFLKGRQIFINLAVDKATAQTLTTETGARDRRNLYLKEEGRVENTEANPAWDDLPESDKLKRQTAWSDKNTKLRSPLFFINANRLSIRNLSKTVDEAGLKRLCAQGVTKGLRHVQTQDLVSHWKASGILSARELLTRAQQEDAIPEFDESNVKQHIPSVHVHRDFSGGKTGVSRGFGFAEFAHHAHAMACLRELNNNPEYSHAAGGKSRLIVEFTVENKAKARQQAAHKDKQRANQHQQVSESKKAIKPKAKKHRGAIQREKKRKQRENPEEPTAETIVERKAPAPAPVPQKAKKVKPPKKKPKVDSSDANFAELVESYKKQAVAIMGGGAEAGPGDTKKKRWFE